IRGPFPTGEITRYILLGRIRLDDELSRDRRSWSPAGTLTGLLPHEMLNLSCWEDYQRYIEARMRVDERRIDRRCSTCSRCTSARGERRVIRDRRHGDDPHTIDRYLAGVLGLNRAGSARAGRLRMFLLSMLLAMLVLAWLAPVAR
ncbi:MAG: hypothetical protein PVI50_08050, partial [Gammaproteobacteria bacterium]